MALVSICGFSQAQSGTAGSRGCKELTYTAFCTLSYKGPEHPQVGVPAGVLEPGPTDPKGRLGFEGIKTRM